MTLHQKLIAYSTVLLAGYLFTWPFALAAILFFCEVNGDIPTRYPLDQDPEQ